RNKDVLLPLNYGHHSPRRVTNRLRYASFVSTNLGLVYVETPKAACTVVKWILAIISGHDIQLVRCRSESNLEMCVHNRNVHPLPSLNDFPNQQVRDILHRYRTFCVVRNPFTRLVSAWANKIRQHEPGYGEICASIAEHRKAPSSAAISFRDF